MPGKVEPIIGNKKEEPNPNPLSNPKNPTPDPSKKPVALKEKKPGEPDELEPYKIPEEIHTVEDRIIKK